MENIESESVEEQVVLPDDAQGILSQRDFVHTPFEVTAWEVVGERVEQQEFAPIEIEVMPSDMTRPDPMFWDFGGGVGSKNTFSQNDTTHFEEAPFEPVIDEAVLEAARAEAYEAGRLQGLAEAQQQVVAEVERIKGELNARETAFRGQIVNELESLAHRTEKNALELAIAVAKKILVTTAEAKPEYIHEVIRTALGSVSAGKALKVRISIDDFEFLEVIGVPPDISTAETGVKYVPDESISSGCIIETEFGEVDMRLESMWEQVKESLYEVAK